jgi:hypothetical protein
MTNDKEIHDAQHEMLLKEVIGDLQRIISKVQTLLAYHRMTEKIEEKNKGNSKDSFTV